MSGSGACGVARSVNEASAAAKAGRHAALRAGGLGAAFLQRLAVRDHASDPRMAAMPARLLRGPQRRAGRPRSGSQARTGLTSIRLPNGCSAPRPQPSNDPLTGPPGR